MGWLCRPRDFVASQSENDVEKRILPLAVLGWLMTATGAVAGNSFVLADGLNRAPAMTLHCVGNGGSAVPCGIPGQPLSVTQTPGGSTAANQSTAISVQQSILQTLGTPNDNAYSSGAGSVVGLLKGLFGSGATAGGSQGGILISRSQSVPALQSVALFAANATRRYLAFQAPVGSFIWVNFSGGVAAPNGLDCVYFAAGSLYESAQFVNRGAVTFYTPTSANIAAWEY